MASSISINVPGSVSAAGTGTGTGEITYIDNPSAADDLTGWTNVGDLDVQRTTTASELPRESTLSSGIKITADANTQSTADYVYYDFTLDDIDTNRLLKIEWSQLQVGSYVDGNLEVIIAAQSDRTTALATPVNTSIPAKDGTFTTSFLSDSTLALSLVIRPTADMATDEGIVISDVVVGPGKTGTGAVVGSWTGYTPTISGFGSETNVDFRYRRVGESIEIMGEFTAGTVAASEAQIGIPSGLTLDTGTMTGPIMVAGSFADDNGQVDILTVLATDGDAYFNIGYYTAGSAANQLLPRDGDVIGISSVRHSFYAMCPISEWSGSGTMNVLQEDNLSEWTSYAPTFGNFDDHSASGGYWKRVGSDMHVRVYGQLDTGGVGGTISVSLPSGYNIDSSVIPKSAYGMVGMVSGYDQSGTAKHIAAVIINNTSTTSVIFSGDDTVDLWNASVPFAWTTGDFFDATFTIPIAEWANVNQNSLVGFSEATTTNVGLVKKKKYQINVLSSTISATNSDIAALKFENLTIGQIYRVTFQGALQLSGTSTTETADITIKNNSVTIARHYFRIDSNPSRSISIAATQVIFEAAATSVVFGFTETGTTELLGTGATSETFSMLEELDDYEETSEW